MIITVIFLLLFCNGTCCCCMMSKPVYFKIKMWICCITVHIVIDQIFLTTGFFSLFFCVFLWILLPGCSLLKNWILLSQLWKKCMKFWFLSYIFKLWFLSHQGEVGCRFVWTLDSEKVKLGFSSRRFYRWAPRGMLLNVFPSDVEAKWSILSLCLYALISLLCVCVRVYENVCVCDQVITGQFNLLKIYVHPALPPQALNLSTAVCMFQIFHLCLRPLLL